MRLDRIFKMPFERVYQLYIIKVERKGQSSSDVDMIILWLTGYTQNELEYHLKNQTDFETFFNNAKLFNPNASKIKGVICGHRVEEIQDPLMQKIRYLDLLIDELARGKKMDKILRINY
jgi:hypothetical protein